MCCKSKEMKTEKDKQSKSFIEKMCTWTIKDWQGAALISLMASMIILILYIVLSTICNGYANRNYRKSFNNKVCQIVNEAGANSYNLYRITNSTLANYSTKQSEKHAKKHNTTTISESKECVLIEKEDLEYILQQHITDHSSIMDVNNYLAIILTLITLCVTLAAVIPYIMGKSILEKDIKDAVEEIHESETVKYQKLVDQLERSEAHLSRMTAYNLLVEYKLELNKCDACGKKVELNLWKHPYWVIGWASKAIIRYLRCSSEGFATEKFINNCIEYIEKAGNFPKENTVVDDKDGVVLRAFVDLFDALQIGQNKPELKNSVLYEILNKLWNALTEAYKSPNRTPTEVENFIFNQVKKKAKYKEYLPERANATEQDFLLYFSERKRQYLDI